MSHPRDTLEGVPVVLNPPEDVIAERCRLGLDRHDEVWGGNYYMVPPANNEHQRVGGKLFLIFWPLAEAAGLEYRYESGLYDPLADPASWCVPDQLAYRPEHGSERGVEGHAELVIEFRSPGDDAIRKLRIYQWSYHWLIMRASEWRQMRLRNENSSTTKGGRHYEAYIP